jgi:hypothetical protein
MAKVRTTLMAITAVQPESHVRVERGMPPVLEARCRA